MSSCKEQALASLSSTEGHPLPSPCLTCRALECSRKGGERRGVCPLTSTHGSCAGGAEAWGLGVACWVTRPLMGPSLGPCPRTHLAVLLCAHAAHGDSSLLPVPPPFRSRPLPTAPRLPSPVSHPSPTLPRLEEPPRLSKGVLLRAGAVTTLLATRQARGPFPSLPTVSWFRRELSPKAHV